MMNEDKKPQEYDLVFGGDNPPSNFTANRRGWISGVVGVGKKPRLHHPE